MVEATPGTSTSALFSATAIAERGKRAEDAVASDHRDLNVLAACQLDDQRDHALVRQVGALERLVDFDQRHVLGEIGGAQMRADQFEITRRQRRQETIWWARNRIQSRLLPYWQKRVSGRCLVMHLTG